MSGHEGNNEILGELCRDYFEVLVGDYRTMEKPATNRFHAAGQEADDIINNTDVKDVTWAKIYRLELAMLRLQPVDGLRRMAWDLREQFSRIATDTELKAYEKSLPPDPNTSSEQNLRQDLEQLRAHLTWRYTAQWAVEKWRACITRRICWYVGVPLLLYLLGLVILLAIPEIPLKWDVSHFRTHLCLSALLVAAWAGLAGGFISTLQRIQSAKLDGNSALNLIEFTRGVGTGILVSPFLGAIFGTVLSLLFLGRMITGSLFPDFSNTNDTALISNAGLQMAKLAVWCFIAGFMERMVPDRLKQLSQPVESPSKLNGKPVSEPVPRFEQALLTSAHR